ncbi:hypothetical protein BB559_001320 [Furculomyces boomerangus]|uniref:Uncharacterized protein n=2 Tax=Harpellales TaxID=61421 RepID=A0A2T9Z2F1_9FUNG|nr:hypothetical protein BB559_001320 [Furculomyces boomerangus]PVZ98784.1 hypothetical protein BB558_005213 [Smittium angustum]
MFNYQYKHLVSRNADIFIGLAGGSIGYFMNENKKNDQIDSPKLMELLSNYFRNLF